MKMTNLLRGSPGPVFGWNLDRAKAINSYAKDSVD